MVQQPQYYEKLGPLKKLVVDNKITMFGSMTFFEELSGFAPKDFLIYKKTLDEYCTIAGRKILKPFNELVRLEWEKFRILTSKEIFLDDQLIKKLFDPLRDVDDMGFLADQIRKHKSSNKLIMDAISKGFCEDPRVKANPKRTHQLNLDKWHKNFPAQMNSWARRILGCPDSETTFDHLQHIPAFFGYFLTHIYEIHRYKKPYKEGDNHDGAYYTEAAAVDILITEDKSFKNTCDKIPNRKVEVMSIEQFFKEHTA